MAIDLDRQIEEKQHNRKVSLGGLWARIDAINMKAWIERGIMVTGFTAQDKGGEFLLIVKARSRDLTRHVQFIPIKDYAHVGDGLLYAITQGEWRDEKPFDVAAWQANNRKRELSGG